MVPLGLRLLSLCAALAGGAFAAAAPGDGLEGKVVVGYQGWFAPEGDGTGMGWFHYGAGHKIFRPGSCTFDLWPDLSELPEEERYPTPFRFADGSVAPVFSSADPGTVDLHFRWMREYGIDAAALQRFGSDLREDGRRRWRDRVLDNCRAAAARQGRQWFLMYDLSGLAEGEAMGVVAADWRRLVRRSDFRNDPAYLRVHGKPLVAVWGVGFGDRRGYSAAECGRLISFLKDDPECGGNAVLEGVPYFWRDGERDALPLAETGPLYALADVISPWSVGRYATPDDAAKTGPRVRDDLAWCRERGIAYLPVFFPGFSWQNLEKTRGRQAPLAAIPREKGRFLWAQAAAAVAAGARAGYVAMFDEIDEGTAIFKVTNAPPAGESAFATYEGLPSDFYLWLTGRIGEGFRRPGSATPNLPSRPSAP